MVKSDIGNGGGRPRNEKHIDKQTLFYGQWRIMKRVALLSLLVLAACGDECANYKKLACENPNTSLCHEAMKETPGLSAVQCREKIEMIKTVRAMQKMEEESKNKQDGSK